MAQIEQDPLTATGRAPGVDLVATQSTAESTTQSTTQNATPSAPRFRAPWFRDGSMLSKVPEVTALFWITKVLTTGMGETTADYLVHQIDPPVAVGLAGICLLAALALQFAVRRYVPWVYWLAVVMVSIFGTMAADAVHVGLGIPYLLSTAAFVLALAAVFLTWRATEKSLSIHSIVTRRRELFYWATVLTTFALGTAAGDLTAMTFNLGYLASGVLFAALIAVPALAYRFFGMNATLAFWFAYVVTRPLGASFADWAAVSPERGGLDLGAGPVSLVLALAIIALIALIALPPRSRESALLALKPPR